MCHNGCPFLGTNMDFPGMAWKKLVGAQSWETWVRLGGNAPQRPPKGPPNMPRNVGATMWHPQRADGMARRTQESSTPLDSMARRVFGGRPVGMQTSVARRGAVQRKCRGRDRRWGSKTPAAFPATRSYVFVAPRRKFLCFSSVSTGSSYVLRDLSHFVG